MQTPEMLWAFGTCLSTRQDCAQDAPAVGDGAQPDRPVLTDTDYPHVATARIPCEGSVRK